MYRPIIILSRPVGGEVSMAYLGEDAAQAEKIYQALASDPTIDEVVEYYFPAARRAATPSTSAQVAALSIEIQQAGQRERLRAEVKSKALARLTAQTKSDLLAQAEAEAAAAVQAADLTSAAIGRVLQQASTPARAEAAVVNEVVSSAELAAAQDRADREAEPALRPEPAERAEPSASSEDSSEESAIFAPPPRRVRNSKA